MLDAKHEKSFGTPKIFFLFTSKIKFLPIVAGKVSDMHQEKNWLFPEHFSCLESKIIDEAIE